MTHIPGHNRTNNIIFDLFSEASRGEGSGSGGFFDNIRDTFNKEFTQKQREVEFGDTDINFDSLLSFLQGGDIEGLLGGKFGFLEPDELTDFLPSEEPTLEKIGQAREGLQSGQQNLTNQFTQAFGQASSQQGQRNLAGAGRSFTDPLTEQFNTTSGNLNRGFDREKTNLQEDFLNKFLDRIADFFKFEAANG